MTEILCTGRKIAAPDSANIDGAGAASGHERQRAGLVGNL